MSLGLIGVSAALNALNDLAAEPTSEVIRAVDRSTLSTAGIAAAQAPRDEGDLQRSLTSSPATMQGGSITGYAGTASPYGRRRELGFLDLFDRLGRGPWTDGPQPFLGTEQTRRHAEQTLSAEVEAAIAGRFS